MGGPQKTANGKNSTNSGGKFRGIRITNAKIPEVNGYYKFYTAETKKYFIGATNPNLKIEVMHFNQEKVDRWCIYRMETISLVYGNHHISANRDPLPTGRWFYINEQGVKIDDVQMKISEAQFTDAEALADVTSTQAPSVISTATSAAVPEPEVEREPLYITVVGPPSNQVQVIVPISYVDPAEPDAASAISSQLVEKPNAEHWNNTIRSIVQGWSQTEAELQNKIIKEQEMLHEIKNLSQMVGYTYIKRDIFQRNISFEFPINDEIQRLFINIDFEGFAGDAIYALQNDVSEFVSVMRNLYTQSLAWFQNQLSRKMQILQDEFFVSSLQDHATQRFWYSSLQKHYYSYVRSLSVDQLIGLLRGEQGAQFDAKIITLHDTMIGLAKEQQIVYNLQSKDTKELTFPTLLQFLLLFHVICVLSDPPCYLHPTPGEVIPFQDNSAKEICKDASLSTNNSARNRNSMTDRVKRGENVLVLFPALYFDDPTKTTDSPVQPCLVKRLA